MATGNCMSWKQTFQTNLKFKTQCLNIMQLLVWEAIFFFFFFSNVAGENQDFAIHHMVQYKKKNKKK